MSFNFQHEDVLYGLACECESLFDQVFEALKILGEDSSICQLYAEFQQRFAIWASHLGVFARKSQCLDRRLRNFPDLQDIVSRLLDILRRSLYQCGIEIKSRARRESSTLQHDGALVPEPSHDEIVQMRAIDDVLTRLSRLGVTIRQSNRPNIGAKVKKFLEGRDLRPFTSLCEKAVQSLYPDAHPSLHEYLSKSMTDRYATILFQDSRHKKLETRRELPLELSPRSPKRNEGQKMATPLFQESVTLKNPKITTHIAPAFSTPSQSDLSSVNIKMVRDRLRRSLQASTSPSQHKSSTILFTQSNYPKLPTASDDSRVIKCEWCAQFLNKNALSAKDWRRHVDRDLKPYVCLSEQCPENHPTYPTFDEWEKHMISHGRRWHQNTYLTSRWFCTFCHSSQGDYDHPEALYAHLDEEHSAAFPPEQLQAISRQSKTEHSRGRNDCLLCCFILEQDDEVVFPKRRKGVLNQQTSKSPRKDFRGKGPERRNSDDETSSSSSDSENSTIDQDMETKNPPKGIARHIAGHLQVLMILTTRFGALMNQDEDLNGDVNSDSVDVDEGGSDSNGNDLGKLSDIDSDEDSLMEEDKSDVSVTQSDPDLDDSYRDDDVPVPDTDFNIEMIPRQHDNLRPEDDIFMQGILESGAYRATESVQEANGKTTTHSSLWNDVKEYFRTQNDRETATMLERRVDNGQTPLSWVTAAGWFPLARTLLQKGADPNERDRRDGRTALHLATLFWHEDIVRLLLDHGAEVDAKDMQSETALHIAATHKRDDIAWILLEHGADINSIDAKGETPLCVAASNRECMAVAELFIKKGAVVNHQNSEGQTPLGLASACGHEDMVILLLNYGPEVDLADKKGRTPLGLAAAKGHEQIVILLLRRGADMEKRDVSGHRPQSIAQQNGHMGVFGILFASWARGIKNMEKDDGPFSALGGLDSIVPLPQEPLPANSVTNLQHGNRELQPTRGQVLDSLSSWPLVDRTTAMTPLKELSDHGEERLGNRSQDSSRLDPPKSTSKHVLLRSALEKANTAVNLDNDFNFELAIQAYTETGEMLGQVLQRTRNDDDKRKLEAIKQVYSNRVMELQQIPSLVQTQDSTVRQVTSVTPVNQTKAAQPEDLPAASKVDSSNLLRHHPVLKSLIKNEAAFVRDMNILVEIYRGTTEACDWLDANTINLLFGNCDKIIEFHTNFLYELKQAAAAAYSDSITQQIRGRSDAEGWETRIGSVFENNMASMKAIHQKFMQTRDKRQKCLDQLLRHPEGKVWLDECRDAAKDLTEEPDIGSLIEQPIQRIAIFQTLLSRIIKDIPEDRTDAKNLKDAMDSLKKMDIEIQQTQNDHEIARQVLDKGRKDSNLTRVLSRRVDKIRVPNIEIPEDPLYTKLRESFNNDYLLLQVYLGDLDKYIHQISRYEEELLNHLSSMELMMRLSPSSYPELEHKWAQFNAAVHAFQKDDLDRHVQKIRERVISPLNQILETYGNPSTAMKMRQELRLDYEQAEQLKRDNKTPSSRLKKLVEQYEALNGTLKTELPILSSLTRRMCEISLENFITIQKHWYSVWGEKMKSVLGKTTEMPDLEEVVSTFQGDFAFGRNNSMLWKMISPIDTTSEGRSSRSRALQSQQTLGREESAESETANLIQRRELEKATGSPPGRAVEPSNPMRQRDAYNVIWLAASLFEFNSTGKLEAGYPYLTYQAGEVFDVLAEKGELWLSINQDDPTRKVGWIWSRHFAKLALPAEESPG